MGLLQEQEQLGRSSSTGCAHNLRTNKTFLIKPLPFPFLRGVRTKKCIPNYVSPLSLSLRCAEE